MEQRISMVTLGVADVGRSRRFYESLGWRAADIGGDAVAFFQAGGVIVGLYGRTALAEDARLPPEGSGFGGFALAHNVRTREAVDALLAEVAAAGGRILKPAEEAFWGGYSGYFADLDGHPWEVAWNPSFSILADGSIRLPG